MPAQLDRQHQQGAIVSRMLIGLFRELFSIHKRGDNPGMTFNDFFVVMAIYAESDGDSPEVTISNIVDQTGIARTSVERILETLVEIGMILKIDARRNVRFVSNPDFANSTDWAGQAERVRNIILSTADELRALWGGSLAVLVMYAPDLQLPIWG